MNYYSIKNKQYRYSFKEAVLRGLGEDEGLLFPDSWPKLPDYLFYFMDQLSLPELAYEVVAPFIGPEIPEAKLREICNQAFHFEIPLQQVDEQIHALELFHGPTLAFKDVGAGFLSKVMSYFTNDLNRDVNVLVATSGDTGSAVAHSFYKAKGVRAIVLYPSGKISRQQEMQFATLGHNITVLEVDGTFDDCQRLVKQAFNDQKLKNELFLTSANSINIGRLLPQLVYYFYAFAQLKNRKSKLVVSVPSGNYGNLLAGLITRKLGLPIDLFIAGTNANSIVPDFLESGRYQPKVSVKTIANAMDVGHPSNFERILHLYDYDINALRKQVQGYSFADDEILKCIHRICQTHQYVLDPHGAIGYLALERFLKNKNDYSGIFLHTAHPAKFRDDIAAVLPPEKLQLPNALVDRMKANKQTISIPANYNALKEQLLRLDEVKKE
jgi:threonine synthase